jgi:hypothetical protein
MSIAASVVDRFVLWGLRISAGSGGLNVHARDSCLARNGTSATRADETNGTQITGTGEVSRRVRSPSKPWLRAAIMS